MPATDQPVEPASFQTLVTMLTTQALVGLGQIAMPGEEQPVVRKELAKHFIDSLAVLEAKTKGNLAKEEAELLDRALHELRMLFLVVK